LSQIGPDGSLKSELRRQTRALLYHQYYLSGLLYLRKIRAALGSPATPAEVTTLRRLASFVESSLCDPAAIAKASGGFKQETAPADQFAIGLAFGQGIVDDRWSRCGVVTPATNDETLGGSLRVTLAVLEGEAGSAHPKRAP
jgi:hypothetical protein